MSKNLLDFTKSAFNYQLYDDGVPTMQVKHVLAIFAIAGVLGTGFVYVGKNLPDIKDSIIEFLSTDEVSDTKIISVPVKTLG